MIAKEELEHGAYYRGRCRNATLARWNDREERFYHWRFKWGMTFLETIKHPEDEDRWDVFFPEEKVENPEKEIPLDFVVESK